MTVAVIVQARMGSKRFPGKSMADLCGRPMLAHVLERAGQIKADKFALVCPPQDASTFRPLASAYGFELFPQSEGNRDVLGKYYFAAILMDATTIVRITGDCPLLDPAECNRVLSKFRSFGGYASNRFPAATVSSGFDCEVFSMEMLEMADELATEAHDREHVTPWIVRHVAEVMGGPKMSVDTPEDLERVRQCLLKQSGRHGNTSGMNWLVRAMSGLSMCIRTRKPRKFSTIC